MPQRRGGCGPWECGCGRAHTLPFKVMGRSGSVEVVLKPAPQGVGLAVGDIAKSVLRLAGITDAWGFTKGHTKTTVNYALATFAALRQTGQVKVRSEQTERLKIKAGAEQVFTRKVEAPPVVAGGPPPGELPEEIEGEGASLTEGPAEETKDEEAPEE